MILAARVLVAILCLAAAGRESILALAEYRAARHDYVQASALAPANPAFLRELAIPQLDSDPATAQRLLTRAVELNSYDAESHIALGLLAESSGQFAEAERHFVQASAVSRRFKPNFALAYFYARRGDLPKFWPVLCRTANIDAAEPEPAFRLAHQVSADPERVASNVRLETHHALESYVRFLARQPDSPTLARLALGLPPGDPALAEAVDALLTQNRTRQAIELWNHFDHGSALDPEAGLSLTNADFRPATSHGFDWRYHQNPGIDLRAGFPGDLRIEFSGHQPESAVILEQYVPVLAHRSYRLHVESTAVETAGQERDLIWRMTPSEDRKPGIFEPTTDLVHLELYYRRSSGSTRLEGVITLHSAALELL